jgi:hypothetical protein
MEYEVSSRIDPQTNLSSVLFSSVGRDYLDEAPESLYTGGNKTGGNFRYTSQIYLNKITQIPHIVVFSLCLLVAGVLVAVQKTMPRITKLA